MAKNIDYQRHLFSLYSFYTLLMYLKFFGILKTTEHPH